jgi:hypothetical protein
MGGDAVTPDVKKLQEEFTPPTVKQHLAASRMLFDWLVTNHVVDANPAHVVRGHKFVVKKGKTPVLTADDAREPLDKIKIVRNTGRVELEEPSLVGLRDPLLVYAFPRGSGIGGRTRFRSMKSNEL